MGPASIPEEQNHGFWSVVRVSTGVQAFFYSDDRGVTWTEAQAAPSGFPRSSAAVSSGSGKSSRAVPDDPDVIYAGTEPSALFRSTDRENRSPSSGRCGTTRIARSGEGVAAGRPIHSVLPDPTDPAHVTVAMSTGGVYRTYDRGETWHPANAGIRVVYAPDPWPEFGQCVHKIAAHPDAPNRIFAQNHGGVYRSENGGGQWTSIADGLPSDFGFPIVVHPHKPRNRIRVPSGCRHPPLPTGGQGARLALRGRRWDLGAVRVWPAGSFLCRRTARRHDRRQRRGHGPLPWGPRRLGVLEHRRRRQLASDRCAFAGRAVRTRRSGLEAPRLPQMPSRSGRGQCACHAPEVRPWVRGTECVAGGSRQVGSLSEPFPSPDTALIIAWAARTPCSWACWLTVVKPHQRDIG